MDKNQIDPMSRDYDPSKIVPDERFIQTTKEFWITGITFIIFSALMIINLFVLGKDPSSYTYVLGLPLWIFLEIVILVGMVVAQELIVTYVYKDMDVTPHGKIKNKKEK